MMPRCTPPCAAPFNLTLRRHGHVMSSENHPTALAMVVVMGGGPSKILSGEKRFENQILSTMTMHACIFKTTTTVKKCGTNTSN